MSLDSALHMLLGAALVAIGVLATALADRIRGIRATREQAQRTTSPRSTRAPIEIVEAQIESQPPPKPVRAVRPQPQPQQNNNGADDVITALVAAGYKKTIATEAVWGCTQVERATIEGWTRAALRRATRGGMS